jgi:hypothetical protein
MDIETKTDIWYFFNAAKTKAVSINMPQEQLISLKQECDDLFCQATGCPVCPAWWIGGF